MKQSVPVLLPLLRTRTQGDVLAWIFLHPDESYSIAEIARAVGTSEPTVLREVDRLAAADLIGEVRRGRARLIRPNSANPATRPLGELLAVTYGPIPVVREELDGIAGIESAWIYGSWAERYSGVPGRSPGDVDVLVVGTANEDELWAAAERATRRIGREVSIQLRGPKIGPPITILVSFRP
ncbi:MAG: winged helix-turn-helix domain-containing protein [Micropruina sp.]|uniref:winged helix-turn-helix domain-containing protein n=1 Tax=Micropruina sp. TaxID=2737536 RepID=UPI0039E4C29A